jgi:uncharacterized protein YdeI (YjbR/CyaY-like superfamily)
MTQRRPAAPAPRSFKSAAAFRTWLERHHASAGELTVRCFRVRAADRGMTRAQAVEEALCFGWIDGRVKSLDADTYLVRFTPRKARSIWSLVNVRLVNTLMAAGRMAPAGLATYAVRDEARTGIYAFEREPVAFAPALLRQFKAQKAAWTWFQTQAPWYRRTATFWVMNAKKEETRLRRLGILIDCSGRGVRIDRLLNKKDSPQS